MDQETLHLFCKQLAHWADAAADSGRSPFRRAESFFPLLTEKGEIAPPLIFWINRDSFMAGGLLFFPSQAPPSGTEAGIACADALGLRHFVTWAPREIVIWEIRDRLAEKCKSLPLPAAETSSAEFCHIFLMLLEELKQLSVAGAIPPPALSPFYFANLCRLARRSAMPFIEEAYRIARAENSEPAPSSAPAQQNYLLLLRLLTLLLEDRLPPAIQPEGLDRALHFALDTLPGESRYPLKVNDWELPLPSASAVRLHHLNRRLTQLDFAADRPRCRRTLEILLADAAEDLGGAPPPPLPEAENGGKSLLLFPDRCYPEAEVFAEVGPAPLLAFTSLLHRLHGEAGTRQQSTDLLTLGESPLPSRIRGKLPESGIPGAPERRKLAARLRLSWPNRRFPLPAHSPRWFFEFLHLLGLVEEGGILALNTPDWLKAPFGDLLFGLFRENFALMCLQRHPHGLQVQLRHGAEWRGKTALSGADRERQLPWARLRKEPATFLRLALDLPNPSYRLLEDGVLRVPEDWPKKRERGIFLFSRSSLGKLLWHLIGNGLPLPSRAFLAERFTSVGVPLPPPEILRQLESFFPEDEPAQASLDRELAVWLGVKLPLSEAAATDRPKAGRRAPLAKDALADRIRRSVFMDGIPQFPEHYLYEHFRPKLIEYPVHGHLTVGEEFMGQYTLADEQGRTISVEGSETARALVLASFSGCSAISLPADQHLTASLLERYLQDLRALHLALVRESHRYLHAPRAADALAEKIWSELPLPPWRLVEN